MTKRDLPPAGRYLCDLGLPPLSAPVDELRRRTYTCLRAIAQGGLWVKVALAGYTVKAHEDGIYIVALLGGQRTFGEWRLLRSLRPMRDPDLPRHVATLDRFFERWQPLALGAADAVQEQAERDEVKIYVQTDPFFSTVSKTWRAKNFANRLRGLAKIPIYAAAWDSLVAAGLEDELVSFDAVLGEVQRFIREAPLEPAELDEMHHARERHGPEAQAWLDERRAQFASLSLRDRDTLALGDIAPPAGFDSPLSALSRITSSGRG